MGMYTELHFNSELKKNTPENVLNTLKYMISGEESIKPTALPDHDLFETERWEVLFLMDSYYFDADTHCTLRHDTISDTYYLCVRSNLKNYGSEIEKFIDWIMPYLDKFEGDFLGFYRYEESEQPTLIYYRGTDDKEINSITT